MLGFGESVEEGISSTGAEDQSTISVYLHELLCKEGQVRDKARKIMPERFKEVIKRTYQKFIFFLLDLDSYIIGQKGTGNQVLNSKKKPRFSGVTLCFRLVM